MLVSEDLFQRIKVPTKSLRRFCTDVLREMQKFLLLFEIFFANLLAHKKQGFSIKIVRRLNFFSTVKYNLITRIGLLLINEENALGLCVTSKGASKLSNALGKRPFR